VPGFVSGYAFRRIGTPHRWSRLQALYFDAHHAANQLGQLPHPLNFRLHSRPHFCYKQSTESSGVASRSYCLQLSGFVRHLIVQEERKPSIVPATGLHSESNTFPKGTFKARTSKGIFSQFLVFRVGLRKMSAESCVSPERKTHTVACIRAPKPKTLSFRAERGILVFAGSLSCSRLPKRSSCGNHLEILWEAPIDRILHTAVCL
jgi:hypothetical protein